MAKKKKSLVKKIKSILKSKKVTPKKKNIKAKAKPQPKPKAQIKPKKVAKKAVQVSKKKPEVKKVLKTKTLKSKPQNIKTKEDPKKTSKVTVKVPSPKPEEVLNVDGKKSIKKVKKVSYLEKMKESVKGFKENPVEETVITDAQRRAYCTAVDCDQIAQVETYCRYHYLSLWKKIQKRREILGDNQIITHLENIVDSNPLRMIYVLYKDFSNERDFLDILHEIYSDEIDFGQEDSNAEPSNEESEVSSFEVKE